MEHRFLATNIVFAIRSDAFPMLLRHRRIPIKAKLHMQDAQLNFPAFERLLFAEVVVNIGIGQIVRGPEVRITIITNQALTELIQGLVGVPHHCCIQDVVVVLTVVEPDEK